MSDLKAGHHGREGKFLIALTGNIACGKSLVLQMLCALGAAGLDADAAAHGVMAPGTPANQAVVDRFGPAYRLPDGNIDRRRLGDLVFADAAALRDLEAIIHPAVRERIWRFIDEANEPVVVVDGIKIVESGFAARCDALWVVTCAPTVQLQRLMARNGFSEAAARLRIAAQPPQDEKARLADVVLDNSGEIEATGRQVQEAWNASVAPWLRQRGLPVEPGRV